MDCNGSIFKYTVAPMVNMSELAFRMFMRENGATCCFSPMFNASIFARDKTYQEKCQLNVEAADRPLIVQFCANNVDDFVNCCKIVDEYGCCDGVDLNLGCPQSIARTGHYGAFLMDEWDLISNMVKAAKKNVKIMVSCKIRVYKDEETTLRYAKMLEESGCDFITVHGRTITQKGCEMGMADWDIIKKVNETVNIPVIANGNCQKYDDIVDCHNYIKCCGVMSATGILSNPYIFLESSKTFDGCEKQRMIETSIKYMSFAKKYNTPAISYRSHLFKFLRKIFDENGNFLVEFSNSVDSVEKCELFLDKLNTFYINGEKLENNQETNAMDEIRKARKNKKQIKKFIIKTNKEYVAATGVCACSVCQKTFSSKCIYRLCKTCCNTNTNKKNVPSQFRSLPNLKCLHK